MSIQKEMDQRVFWVKINYRRVWLKVTPPSGDGKVALKIILAFVLKLFLLTQIEWFDGLSAGKLYTKVIF